MLRATTASNWSVQVSNNVAVVVNRLPILRASGHRCGTLLRTPHPVWGGAGASARSSSNLKAGDGGTGSLSALRLIITTHHYDSSLTSIQGRRRLARMLDRWPIHARATCRCLGRHIARQLGTLPRTLTPFNPGQTNTQHNGTQHVSVLETQNQNQNQKPNKMKTGIRNQELDNNHHTLEDH